MDIGQIGDDGWTSLRTSWREEPWLPAGVVLAAVVYPLWLGLTGAAMNFLVGAIAGEVTIQPWTSTTTLLVVLLGLLWVVGPAALATVLTVGRVTNYNDNLRTGYRLRHPLVLLAPPAVLLGIGYGALVGTGSPGALAVGLLLAGGLWFAVRTTAYAYRVFSLSLPVVAWAVLFATGVALSSTVLVLGGLAIGRTALVADLLGGLAGQTGVNGLETLHTATVAVAGVSVPTVLAAPVVTAVGGSLAYVVVQVAWSLVVRAWRPTVRRPELRTGQRYPRFARPTTSASPSSVARAGRTADPAGADTADGAESPGAPAATGGAGGPGGSQPSASGSSGAGDDGGPEQDDEMDEVTHTRVFTAPDDADVAAPADLVADQGDGTDGTEAGDGIDGEGRETTLADGSTPGTGCPDCGTPLDDEASVCSNCGADLHSA